MRLRSLMIAAVFSTLLTRASAAPRPSLLLVVNQGAETLSFVDPNAMKVLASIPMAPFPHEIALSGDGKTAYVALYGNREVVGDSIAVVDVRARRELKRFSIAPNTRPHGLVVRGNKLFVTSETSKAVLRLDRNTGAIEAKLDTGANGSHMVAVSSEAMRIYTGNIGSDSVSVVGSKQIPVGKGPEGIALSPDGQEVWAAHRGGGGVSVIDTNTQSVVATLLPEVVSARVAFSPDGKHVLLFDMPSHNVIVVDRATRKETGRIAFNGMPGGGIVAPDNHTAYVTVYQPFSVTRVDLDTGKVTGSVETGIAPDGLALVN